MQKHKAEIWARVVELENSEAVVFELCHIPGMGIVKAAFVAQMLGHDVACLDVRNIRREGRNARAFRTDGKPPEKYRRKIAAYVKETGGRARELWNAWCEEVAAENDLQAWQVSQMHLLVLGDAFADFETPF